MKTILIMIALFLTLCSCNKSGTEYNLLITRQTHTINVNTENNKFEISSPLFIGDIMSLKKHPSDDKVVHGEKDDSDSKWKFYDGKNEQVKEIIVAPYFGMFSYNVLQRIQNSGIELLNPMCPVTTKYLFIAVLESDRPIIGCIEPKND